MRQAGISNKRTSEDDSSAAAAENRLRTSQGTTASNPTETEGARVRLIRLDTLQNDLDHAAKIRVFRLAALHEPLKHIGVFATEQFAVASLIFWRQIR